MAYINQYEADMAQNRRDDQAIGEILSGVKEGMRGFEENRRRALEEKRRGEQEKMQKLNFNLGLAEKGVSADDIKALEESGDASGIFSRYAAGAEAAKIKRAEEAALDKKLKESQIFKNTQQRNDPSFEEKERIKAKYRDGGNSSTPYLETKEGKAFVAKEEFKNKNKIGGKNAHEFKSRMDNIIGESEQLKALINEKGTFEAFGPHNQTLAQKVDAIAIDAAKLFDPESVARESEVAAFRNMLFDPGSLTTRNSTAIGTIDGFKKLIQDRAARSQGVAVSGDNQPIVTTPQIQQKVQSMTPEQKQARLEELRRKAGAR